MHNGKKIGLALSGGGVRATAFHMGVLRGLHRLGILQEVDEISTVSGGSIAGVYYLLNREKKFEAICDDMVQKLQKSIELRTVLNPRMLATIWPSYSRSNVKASVYRSLFFGEKTLSSLPDAPKIFINAACLNTGKSWRFSKSRMGGLENWDERPADHGACRNGSGCIYVGARDLPAYHLGNEGPFYNATSRLENDRALRWRRLRQSGHARSHFGL